MPPLISYDIKFPEGFHKYAWEVEAKGWLPDILITINHHHYRVTFYDPTRLAQDVESELRGCPAFFQSNLVVVSHVTPACMESAIASIVAAGTYAGMVQEEESTQETVCP